MRDFLMTPLGQATVAIAIGLLIVAYPPGAALFAAGGLLAFGFSRLVLAWARPEPREPITLTCRRTDHDAQATGAACDLVPGRDRDLSARP